ncbi:hypothetical protein PM3016_475 [Paenibacillus mucilaginosus 3016]|uniref:Lipoprotein n=1 Tax=Paenibacillus mucilaginosus 3016 TaxID=1116391 RepID=H6NSM4_9BACL|nr:hypothetical protein PM3016_475 [Paenibacillus mucilaginosus 3016]
MKPALSSLNARRPSKLMPLFAAAALTAAAGCSPGPAGSAPPPAYSSTAGSRPPAATASSAQVPPEDFCADADQDRSFDDCSGFIDAAENAAFYGGAVPYYRRSSGGLAGRSPAASQPSKTAPGSTVENKAPGARCTRSRNDQTCRNVYQKRGWRRGNGFRHDGRCSRCGGRGRHVAPCTSGSE